VETIELKANPRDQSGKGPSRRYRMEGLIPAVVYGRGDATIPLTVDEADLQKIIRAKKEKHFIKLLIGGDAPVEKVSILKELQYKPIGRKLYHADFYEIRMDQKLTVDIPLQFSGTPVGVVNGGELQHLKRELKISCLPSDLPDYIDVDISGLNIGDSLKVRDIVIPQGLAVVDHADVGIAAVYEIKVAAPATETAEAEGAETSGEDAATKSEGAA
jgi:large subunit ribosomal protein L25